MASIIGLALFASATPSPLYGIYQQEWHFSTPVLTLVYAVYCFGVLTALLLIGRISDEVGRRPVLTLSLIGLIGAGVLFAVADSVGMAVRRPRPAGSDDRRRARRRRRGAARPPPAPGRPARRA